MRLVFRCFLFLSLILLFQPNAYSKKIKIEHYKNINLLDTVKDGRGHPIRSSNGKCLRTKWHVGYDKCSKKDLDIIATKKRLIEKPKKTVSIKRYQERHDINFDYDSFELNQIAQSIISSFVHKHADSHSSFYHITGHTDSAGSDDYNTELSRKRAESVVSELLNLGVSRSQIKVSWMGEKYLKINTADGVKNPENRRAEVIITLEIFER